MSLDDEDLNLCRYELNVARQYHLKEKKPIRAFAHLMTAFKIRPDIRKKCLNDFTVILEALTGSLVASNRFRELITCYDTAVDVFSDNEVILDHIGRSLISAEGFQDYEVGKRYFEKSLSVDPNYLPAFYNLQNVKIGVVERWHFRMLNDVRRNDAYRRAIIEKIKAGLSGVMDVGTGTGLLSLYAHEAGADYICACDYSSAMVSIATKVFEQNLPPYSVKLIKSHSTNVSVPKDIPYRCSLLVTETMDSCLLGEHILSTVAHAWSKLLLPPLWARPEPCQRVIPASASLFAAPIESMTVARKHYFLKRDRVPEQKLNFDEVNVVKLDESYDTENLNAMKDFRLLSDPVRVFTVDFNDADEVTSLARHCALDNCFTFNQNGIFDAVAVWFELNLDSNISLNTSPLTTDHCPCWDHGVCPIDYPTPVTSESRSEFKFSITGNEISFKFSPRVIQLARIPQPSIKLLNCVTYQNYIEQIVSSIHRDTLETSYVLDTCPYPYVGHLLSCVGHAKVIAFNEIDPSVLQSLVKTDLITCKPLSDLESNDNCFEDSTRKSVQFNVAVLDLVSSRGEINQDLLPNLPNICASLTPDCLIIPSSIEIWCQLAYSEQLNTYTRVNDPEIHSKYKLADFVNEYSVSTQLDLRLDELTYKEMSAPFLLGTLQTLALASEESLSCNNRRFDVVAQITQSGSVNSVLVWFVCATTTSIDEHRFSTRCHDSYVNQIAEVMPRDLTVFRDQTIQVSTLYNSGIIKFINVGDQRF